MTTAVWQRHTHSTGVPYYTSPRAPGYMIEAVCRLSSHVGMVFGNFTNEVGREARIEGWKVFHGAKQVGPQYGTLKEAKRKVERAVEAARQ
jgi:hypothetical protein